MTACTFELLSVRPTRLAPVLVLLGTVVMVGAGAAVIMAAAGHQVTGLTNRVPWGLPHVVAYLLILAAPGALNVAVIAAVFGRTDYKPLEPLSALLALACLMGGLSLLVLDLGRPDRLLLTLAFWNPRSIFAWNIVLYTGFMLVAAAHLVTAIDPRFRQLRGATGHSANLWRFLLTTGTGLDLGVLVGRDLIHSAVLVPFFIALALALGLAVLLLGLAGLAWLGGGRPETGQMQRLSRLLGLFVGVSAYLGLLLYAVHLYAPAGRDLVAFVLLEGGVYTALVWGGQFGVGTLLALLLAFTGRPLGAAVAVLIGGVATLYVHLIVAQVWPQPILPGMTVSSAFGDGQVATYVPSGVEALFALGGFALAVSVAIAGCRLFRILPHGAAGSSGVASGRRHPIGPTRVGARTPEASGGTQP